MTDKELIEFYKAIADDNQVKINKLTKLLQNRDETIERLKNQLSLLENNTEVLRNKLHKKEEI